MKSGAFERGLVWLRNDLRAADNTALYRAGESCRELAAVYIACPQSWRSHGDGDAVVTFRLDCLRELQPRLAELKIPLYFLELASFDQVPPALVQMARRLGIRALFANAEYPLNEMRRDEAVRAALREIGAVVEYSCDRTLVVPGALQTGGGEAFKIFTPFKRAFVSNFGGSPFVPLPPPAARASHGGWPAWIRLDGPRNLVRSIPPSVTGYSPVARVAGDPLGWAPGEREAANRLQRFLNKIDSYHTGRDYPAIDATSRLSPYLNCGAISIRQCVSAALEYNRGRWLGGDEGAASWLSELLWREFYTHLVAAFPHLCRNRPFRPETELVPWSRDEPAFRSWCLGRTGVPIVDAAMRQLEITGWMHNRLRMIAASFLTKNLLIDWRRGEHYFMDKLIDADFASNNGGWQWVASTGSDAAPYFRVFNPYSQSRRFDPHGEFIRSFLPELRGLSDRDLHCPPPMEGYPPPLCDLAETRRRAIAAFAALK